jgi:hypothetical protein
MTYKWSLKVLIILLIFNLTTGSKALSQNYRLIDANRIRTYGTVDSNYIFIKVDSVFASGDDTTYYFNRLIDTVYQPDCLINYADTSVLGKKMIINSDSSATHIFFNENGDSIFIETLVSVGDTWILYTFEDSSYIKATVVSKAPLGILPNITDTVARLHLNVYSNSDVLLSDTFPNEKKFDITKNYGLIEFYDFNDFPEDTFLILLKGISDPDTAMVDVDAENAFNFQLGDEFHFREVLSDGESYLRQSAIKYYILNKYQYSDSVVYDAVHVQIDSLSNPTSPTAVTFVWDTVTLTYNYDDYAFLDTIELTLFEAQQFGFSDWRQNDSLYEGIPFKLVYDWFEYNPDDSCLSNAGNTYLPEQQYGDGLGLMHYFDSTAINNYYQLDMVFFHKGLKEWGIPYDFSELLLIANGTEDNLNSVNIFPNPASESIVISNLPKLESHVYINIYDLQGRQLIRAHISTISEQSINISSLKQGAYIIGIETNYAIKALPFIKIH